MAPLLSALPASRAQPIWGGLIGNGQPATPRKCVCTRAESHGGRVAGAAGAIGGALGHTDNHMRADRVDGNTDISRYNATMYGGKALGAPNVLLGARYGANSIQLFTELGYAMTIGPSLTLELYASLGRSAHARGPAER